MDAAICKEALSEGNLQATELRVILAISRKEVKVHHNTVHCPKVIRFHKTANNQQQDVKWAKDYLAIRESSETIRCTPEMVKT